MSYTKDVRSELLHLEVKKPCCALAEITAMKDAFPDVFSSVDPDIVSRISYLNKKKGEEFSIDDECCLKSYLKGAFETVGTLSNPGSKSPYVELYFVSLGKAKVYSLILSSIGIKSGVSTRRNKYVCYIKNADGISDYLTFLGLPGEALKFIVSKTEREVSNHVNRVTNCDLANIDKTRKKYENEVIAINKIKKNNKLENLPEKLFELANLRLNNPFATYAELGEMCENRCSKSTISLRMREILNFSIDFTPYNK